MLWYIVKNASEKHAASIFQDIYALKMKEAVSFETMTQSTNELGVTSQEIRTEKTVCKAVSSNVTTLSTADILKITNIQI